HVFIIIVKNHKMIKRVLFFVVFLFLFQNFISAQNLSTSQKQKIDDCIVAANKNEKSNDFSVAANYLITAGNIYRQVNMTDDAIEMYSRATNLLENSTNTTAKYRINNQLAYLYKTKNDYVNAEKHFINSYELIKIFGKRTSIASALFNIGQIQEKQNKHQDAINNYDKALTIFLELEDWDNIKKTSFKIAKCYNKIGDEQNYMKYYNLYVTFDKKLKDEIINKKEREVIIQRQITKQKDLKLELELFRNKSISDSLDLQQEINNKSKAEIELQKLQIEQDKKEIEYHEKIAESKHRIILILSLGIILFLLAFLVILKFYIQNKKQKEKLVVLYDELSEKNVVIERNRRELQEKNTHITDSINYASRIQHAILPTNIKIEKNFKDSFIFYLPRDVVSGDFYWFTEVDNYKIIATIDCTGHSVPGAFMSLIANTLLNEIVKTKRNTELAEVLTELNEGLLETLQTTANEDSVDDGLDISMYRFEKGSRKAKFAAANHISIAYIDGKEQVLESDFYSIGGSIETEGFKFSDKEIDLGDEAVIYMFSDGYADQFNEKNKKYLTKRLMKFLETIHELPLSEQHVKISDEYESWKGSKRQIDDILVIGLKI
ncbi:MAG: SpoIIE family protein phosphatase, partial [Bacteroidota bacterium]|nr:SpoIIE family protein phosphatase [Bacteroidota bacterium]